MSREEDLRGVLVWTPEMVSRRVMRYHTSYSCICCPQDAALLRAKADHKADLCRSLAVRTNEILCEMGITEPLVSRQCYWRLLALR
jgi:hypothetical protein